MKRLLNRLWLFVAGTLVMVSCVDDLETVPEGAIFTDDQKLEIAELLPERLVADLNGMYAILGAQHPISERADDFGYASICIAWDHNGPDMVSPDAGYNWFGTPAEFADRNYTYASPFIRWSFFYSQIRLANDLLAAIPEDTEVQELLYYRGQALAVRAFDYLKLVQMYQFTYVGNEDQPGVPIITFDMDAEPGNYPRATVGEVYELIMSDLNEAYRLLEGFTRPNKNAVDQQIARGIRARVNLLMQNWEAAAADAAAARAGYPVLSMQDVAQPGFYTATSPNWMWAALISPQNISTNYEVWPAKLSSLSGNSYTCVVGQYKSINNLLWSKIPDTDVRKGWWVDENLESPILEDLYWPGHEGTPIGPLNIPDVKMPFLPYTNVKFAANDNVIGNGDNSSDWVIMRSEEMILVEAEGLAMSGNVGGATTLLEDFIRTNRDPDYSVTATTPEDMQIEIWKQRRIELWGEGFSFFDLMRLKKNLVRFNERVDTNYPEAMKFNMASNDPWLLLRIPQIEINANRGISETQNNTGGSLPLPGEGAGLSDPVTD